jgi:predicted metal-binding membrane protein
MGGATTRRRDGEGTAATLASADAVGRRRRLRAVVAAVVLLAAVAGWLHLGAMVAAMLPTTDMASLGPGMGLFNRINGFAELPTEVRAALSFLCGPEGGPRDARDWMVVFLMWEAMVAAMMLPTALPVLLAHADATEGARRAGRPAGRTLAVGLGYLTVWTGFAGVATLVQGAAVAARVLTPAGLPASLVLAGTTLVAAGLYQFTPWKLSCLARCRRPAERFAELGAAGATASFRLGVAEGRDCLGCCWALMTAMFAVGVMNVVWIVGLGAVMIAEKLSDSWTVVRLVGLVLVACGLAAIAASPVGTALLARF